MAAPLIIGLSGASSSGKTTVANALGTIFPDSSIIHEDDFYLPDNQIPYNEEIHEYDWDCPGAINFENLTEVVKKLKLDEAFDRQKYMHLETTNISNQIDKHFCVSPDIHNKLRTLAQETFFDRKVYLIDGFLMFGSKQLVDLMDIKLFFRTDYETLKRRRQARKYNVDAGVWTDPPGYFTKCVWPQYYHYHKGIFCDGDDEHKVRSTGGALNDYAKSVLHIDDFINNDDTDFDTLVSDVFRTVIEHVKDSEVRIQK